MYGNESQKRADAIDFVAIGKRIRACRQENRMTQENLAEAIGVSTSFIGHVERGSRIPSVDTLFRIAKALRVSVDALLTGLPQMIDSSANTPKRLRILNDMIWVLNRHADEWLEDQ